MIFNRQHAQLPTVETDGRVLRVFYSSRDPDNRSSIYYFEVDVDDPSRIVSDCPTPVLSPGTRGCFDDSGVMPSCIIHHEGIRLLYYTGWNLSKGGVPYGHGIGLAISPVHAPQAMRRFSDGPLIDRSAATPFLVNSPFVSRSSKGEWRMWFSNGSGWEGNFPKYYIDEAKSSNGTDWRCMRHRVVGEDAEAVSRVFVSAGSAGSETPREMWYAFRTADTDYRIGYASTHDGGQSWHRMDSDTRALAPSAAGWDSEMTCFPFLNEVGARRIMFYNGNGYGATGIGWAEWQE